MVKTSSKKLKIAKILTNHVKLNLKNYIIVLLIFIVGIFMGVVFFNNTKEKQKDDISSYMNNYINKVKENQNINTTENLKNDIKQNCILALGLWFAGTTLVGIPIVFGIILFRGFCLGYTISATTYTLGMGKGLIFVFITLVLQNLFLIPAVLAIGVSGIKLYKSVMKDKRKENLKVEILRHTVLSCLMLSVLIISAMLKTNISGGMLVSLIKYF